MVDFIHKLHKNELQPAVGAGFSLYIWKVHNLK